VSDVGRWILSLCFLPPPPPQSQRPSSDSNKVSRKTISHCNTDMYQLGFTNVGMKGGEKSKEERRCNLWHHLSLFHTLCWLRSQFRDICPRYAAPEVTPRGFRFILDLIRWTSLILSRVILRQYSLVRWLMAHELSFLVAFRFVRGVNNYCNLVMTVIYVPARVAGLW